MSNFMGTARSNYFLVKDVEAFKEWAWALPDIRILEQETENPGVSRYGILSDGDEGCFPTYYFALNEGDEGDDVEIDWKADLGVHLQDGEVCVLMEAGAERTRYIAGWTIAFDNTDKPQVEISLDSIYALAETAFGVEPTRASY